MTRRDARSLDHRTLEEMRRLAVGRVLAGESQLAVARSLEIHGHTVQKWMHWLRTGGEGGLASTKAQGRPPTLAPRQQQMLRRIIVGKNPRQLHFGPALWTVRLVGQLIESRFGVVLHKVTVWRLLHRLGITPQKPIRRAFRRDEEEIRRWVREDFPAIVREAKRRQATLLFEDETGIREDHPLGTTWGLRGQRPVVGVKGTRRRANVISAVSPRGGLWFLCFEGTLTAPMYVAFLEALLADLSKPIVLIHDRHPAHVAALTRRFLREHRGRLRVHELPAYAPELNPDEHVWSYLKGTLERDPLRKEESLPVRVTESMDRIEANPTLVRSFFDHPDVRYIKDALGW